MYVPNIPKLQQKQKKNQKKKTRSRQIKKLKKLHDYTSSFILAVFRAFHAFPTAILVHFLLPLSLRLAYIHLGTPARTTGPPHNAHATAATDNDAVVRIPRRNGAGTRDRRRDELRSLLLWRGVGFP